MLEEDSRFGWIEIEFVEIFGEACYCLSIMVCHSSEYHTIDLDFFIVDDDDMLISLIERVLEMLCRYVSMECIYWIFDGFEYFF